MKQAPIGVIGNSIAAISFIETLRQAGHRDKILLFSKEEYPAYGRPLISYLLAGKIDPDNIFLRSPDFYHKNNVEFLPGEEVTHLDISNHRGKTRSGKKFACDRLLIAAGSKPFIPPLKGIEEASKVFTFTTLDDAQRIQATLKNVKNVVIVGAGLIGLKAAESLSYKNKNISVVELSERILPSVLDKQGSGLFQQRMEKDGIHFYFKNTIQRVKVKNRNLCGVELENGNSLPCDLLIIAAGVKPNTDFLEESLLSENRAISVNRYMQTARDGIYAAGDICEAYDLIYNTVRHMPIWPNAYWQGHFAALSMAGIPYNFKGHVSMNSIGYKDLHMMSAGIVEDSGIPVESIVINRDKSYQRFNFQDEKLVGALFIGDVQEKGVITHLLKHQELVPRLKDKIQKENFSFLDYPREYRIHHLQKAQGKK